MDEKKLREMLGLDENGNVEEAVAGLRQQVVKLTDQIEKMKEQQGEGVVSLAEFKALQERFTETETRLRLRERDDLVRAAMEAGKIVPAMQEWAESYALSDPEGFKNFTEAAPKVVEFGERGGAAEGETDIEKRFLAEAERIKKEKKVGIVEAMNMIRQENRALLDEYVQYRQQKVRPTT